MIGTLGELAGQQNARKLRILLIVMIAEGVLAGIALVMLVPILRAASEKNFPEAWSWLAVMALFCGLFAIVRLGSQLYGFNLSIEVGRALFDRMGTHLGRLPMGWFDTDRIGEVSRMASQGIINVMGIPAHLLRHLIVGLVTPATLLCALFWFDWRLALAASTAIPLVWMLISKAAQGFQEQEHRIHSAGVEAIERILEFAQNQETLRVFGRSSENKHKLDAALVRQHDASATLVETARRSFFHLILAIEASLVVVLVLAINLTIGGRVDAAELVTMLFIIIRYVEPVLTAAQIEGGIRAGQNSLLRLKELQETPVQEEGTQAVSGSNEITLEDVAFSYEDSPVLRDVSLRIPAGSMTALVGPSGAGKTTLLRLISREWDIDLGRILIGDRDIRDVPLQNLMQNISIVFQDTYLFSGTIAENIKLGNSGAGEYDVQQAADLARVSEIIARMPEGIHSPVGEGGALLSGGERQRVAIARALLKKAPILLLDEATAALDPINERAIQHTLEGRPGHQTLVVIAHRLQTIKEADQIVFLEAGEIMEQGGHDELLARDGRYADFWRKRARADGWRLTSAN